MGYVFWMVGKKYGLKINCDHINYSYLNWVFHWGASKIGECVDLLMYLGIYTFVL